jgi:hypothetical protein
MHGPTRVSSATRQGILPVSDAVLRSRLEVSTLEGGKARGDIPAGIQPDTVLRLRVRVPEKLDREARERYERLRALADKPKRHFWK